MTASQLGPGGIILCAVSLTAAACIICVAAVGNPFVLYRFCIPKASLPPPSRRNSHSSSTRDASSQDAGNDANDAAADNDDDEEQQGQRGHPDTNSPSSEASNQDQAASATTPADDSGVNLAIGRRISGPSSSSSILPNCLHPTSWSFFGYMFDIDSYRESVRLRREQQRHQMLDEQIRRLDQLVATERELRQRIADGDTDRATRLQLSRVQRFRYGLAMRTREERRRRRMEFMREVLEADEEAAAQEEQANHFKHTLTMEEKRQVLDHMLDYHQYHKEAVNDDSNANEEKAKGYAAGVKAALSASIRSRMSDRTMETVAAEEKGASVEEFNESGDGAKGESSRLCSICLDEYGEWFCCLRFGGKVKKPFSSFLNTVSNYFNVRPFGQYHRGWGDASNEIRPLSTHFSQVSLRIFCSMHKSRLLRRMLRTDPFLELGSAM